MNKKAMANALLKVKGKETKKSKKWVKGDEPHKKEDIEEDKEEQKGKEEKKEEK